MTDDRKLHASDCAIHNAPAEAPGECNCGVGERVERTTLSGNLPKTLAAGAPDEIDPATGMNKDYWILSDAERAKGFVRPVRDAYTHVGLATPTHLRDLTPKEHKDYDKYGYLKYESYPEDKRPLTGRYWTQAMLDSVHRCGATTTMNIKIAETFARDPRFYGSGYCATCRTHFPNEEFVWQGTNIRVGT